jgi:cystinosin
MLLQSSIFFDLLFCVFEKIGWNLLLQVSIFFDIIFICQHYVIYPDKKPQVSPKLIIEENREPLVKPSVHPQSENV